MVQRVRAVLFAAFLPFAAAHAQSTGGAWPADLARPYVSVGPLAGTIFLRGSHHLAGARSANAEYVGGRLGYQWTPRLGLEVGAGWAPVAQITPGRDTTYYDTKTKRDVTVRLADTRSEARFTHSYAQLRLLLTENRPWTAYLLAGGSGSRIEARARPGAVTHGNLEVGLGLQSWLGDVVALRVESRHLFAVTGDDETGPPSTILGAGLTFVWGEPSRAPPTPWRPRPIYFETGEARLPPDAERQIGSLGDYLTRHPDLEARFEGHADSYGFDAYNQQLSEERARAVLERLLARFEGLERRRFATVGYGATRPIAAGGPNGSRNSRVEVVIGSSPAPPAK